MEKQATLWFEDTFPIFNAKDGYGWTICVEQYWNARGTDEKQRFIEDMRPILSEICWNEVEEWKIEWEEIKARLNLRQEQQQQSQIIQERTQFQPTTEQEIQAKIEEDQETKHKTASKDELEELPEILDQENFQTIQIHTNSPSKLPVEGEAKITDQDPNPNITDQQVISQLNSDKIISQIQNKSRIEVQRQAEEVEIDLDALSSGDGDATRGSKDKGEGFALVSANVLQRPPPKPPNLQWHKTEDGTALQAGSSTTALGGSDINDVTRSRGAKYAEYGVIKEEKRRSTVTTLVNGAAMVEDGSTTVLGGRSKTQAIRRAMLLSPPPLLAAVFPWNRNKVEAETAGNDTVDDAFSKGKGEDVQNVGNRTGLSEMHYRERDDVKSGGGGSAWRIIEDDFPDLTRWRKPSRTTSPVLSGAEQPWMGVLTVVEVVGVVVSGAVVARRSGGHLELKDIPSISLFSSSDEGQMEKEGRVTLMRRKTNGVVPWKPLLAFLGQSQAQFFKKFPLLLVTSPRRLTVSPSRHLAVLLPCIVAISLLLLRPNLFVVLPVLCSAAVSSRSPIALLRRRRAAFALASSLCFASAKIYFTFASFSCQISSPLFEACLFAIDVCRHCRGSSASHL
ncbi:hypothetical protein PIB30_014894 [Stylosanthes scabra]|uniref:Uncharacterized protein n=1 Tax=Stylosanthes scabra TaxID=79078 RepID=A0ABU6U5N6_9FABA|nr:hypothetical protein [Stylosanthes scabra]